MQQFSKREKFFVANTLCCVPVVLEGHAVIIDLLNETSVVGRVTQADGFMNVHLSEVVYIDRNGLQYPFDEFLVRARMIRQIHVPDYMDIEQELRNFTEHGLRPKRPKKQNTGKRTFKQKRAEERHKEIVKEIAEQQKNVKNKD